MFPAPLFLVLLVVTTPVILLFDGPIIHGLVTAAAAVSVAIVALRIRPGEAGFLSTVIRPIAIIAAIPAFWMLFQVLPLKTVGLDNPIWESAAAALGRPLAGPPMLLLRNVKLPRPAAKTISAIMVVAAVSANKTHAARRRSTATAAATNAIATAERYRAKQMSVAPGSMLILPVSGRPSAVAALSQIGLASPTIFNGST